MAPPLTDFTIGWICALDIERVVACELLDEEYEDEHTTYTYGRIKKHNLVIASLPQGRYGTASAARVAEQMRSKFPALQLLLMVGIAGGVPSSRHDIRLGDVIVSSPGPKHGGVVQYDYGKAIQMQEFENTAYLTPPPEIFLNAVAALRTLHKRRGHHITNTISAMLKKNPRLSPDCSPYDAAKDRLYSSDYVHCEQHPCDCTLPSQSGTDLLQMCLVRRSERSSNDNQPVIHYGLIASANQLIKDAMLRDMLARKYDVLCFETEAAGLMDGPLPCLVIRGISDYADSHKNDEWQGYAAATAAAYAKELLGVLPYLVKELPSPKPESNSKSNNPPILQIHFNSSDGLRIQVGGGAYSSTHSSKNDLNVRMCLENVRTVLISSAKENDDSRINICVTLRNRADQIRTAVQSERSSCKETGEEAQLLLSCLERCTELTPVEAAEGLAKTFSGSADYAFERGPKFFPQEYIPGLVFEEGIILMDYIESTRYNVRTIELQCYCAIKTRRWRRVRVLATFKDNGDVPMILPTKVTAMSDMFTGGLPKQFLLLLKYASTEFEFNYRTTRLLVPVDGDLQCDYEKIEPREDYRESDFKNEHEAIEVIRALGCSEYPESQFIILRRAQSYCFHVTDGEKTYVLHKARLSSDRQHQQNGLRLFLEHMIKFLRLSDCSGIPGFRGVVFDDSMSYITGYLCDLEFVDLERAIACAQSKGYTIPRELRNFWARQAIEAVLEVHAKGDFIGRMRTCISQDINITFHDLWGSIPAFHDKCGRVPPELRALEKRIDFTQKTDIFQLGRVIWQLSEHISRDSNRFCRIVNCMIKPTSRCREPHRNPVSLPCSENTDPVWKSIIDQCRQEDPSKRPTAEDLIQQIDQMDFDDAQIDAEKAAFATAIKAMPDDQVGTLWCDECYGLCVERHYHCNICDEGDFDLCTSCVTKGVHCWEPSHQLWEMTVDSRGNMTDRPYTPSRAS